jgi:hypothetical protein
MMAFAEYFATTWTNRDDPEVRWRWFEGASQFGSTNNSLEGFNNQFKNVVTLRKRHNVKGMLLALRKCLVSFSCLEEYRVEKVKPAIDKNTMRKANELRVTKRKIQSYGQGLLWKFAAWSY